MSMSCYFKPLECMGCPFFHCPDGDCFECYCSIDTDIKFEHFWCEESKDVLHKDCPLLKGKVVTIKEDEGKLSIGVGYK